MPRPLRFAKAQLQRFSLSAFETYTSINLAAVPAVLAVVQLN